ncbi:DNA-directed DNA polymerase alpha subunit pol12 [Elasticomyces elasticus]|nr:DNA-directed DNA polymerase alpha subunit pol12 [Elasticomyces elasticus]KAK3658686.1 DNA-directed DNA polymerase alpha subunit pol12 [Elasticomyces elasticus]KAK4913609.1 DNA-directed DNA polymerase alpha subunit pol12 [Elasticomyces elasticus]KAK5756623.1 DNA-directed DNA polymerase alpha subunit pol12 [Elasticomyces elasticus]
MSDSDSDTLTSKFGPLAPDLSSELEHILHLLSTTPEELFFKWESYIMKMGDSANLDLKTLKAFKKDLQDALERESRAKGHVVHQSAAKRTAATPRANGGGDVMGMLDGMVSNTTPASGPRLTATARKRQAGFDTPTAANKSTKNGPNSSPADSHSHKPPATAQTATSFEHRPNPGEIIQQINPHIPSATTAPSDPPTESRVKLKANLELPKFAYKTMAQTLTSASEILDDRIDSFTDLIQSHHSLPDSAFGNPAAQSTAEIVAVGRICSDQPNAKLNASSVVLETSRRMGAGLRVPLKFGEGVGYGLFPGKILAVRGSNVSGEYFKVSEVLALPALPLPASTPLELDVHNDRLTGAGGEEARPLGVLVAAGPYTTDSDLDFVALHTLLAKAEEERTDVLILCGPFLDLEHPAIRSGDLETYLPAGAKFEPDRATLNDAFRLLISVPLQKLVQAVPTITIILVPSLRDAVSKHVSWPQDRLAKGPLGLGGVKQVQIVTNPIVVSVNEIVFAISTLDVLSELRAGDVHQRGAGFEGDMLGRLAAEVVGQRHFFPVFPPQGREDMPRLTGEGEGEERSPVGVGLDVAYLKLGEWVNVRPDVLVLPSVLNPFVKVIEGITTINPGTLSKKRGAGTFVAMNLLARGVRDEERERGEAVGHEVFGRGRVDVVRI